MTQAKSQASAKAFWRYFGEGEQYRAAPRSRDGMDPYPNVLRIILDRDGLASYCHQSVWSCDPEDWRDAVNGWFGQDDRPDVLARSAFGNMLLRQGESYRYVRVHSSVVLTLGSDADRLFAKTLTDSDFSLIADAPDIARARKTTGPLAWDEMYAYAPALALGGDSRTSTLIRVKAAEQLGILAQLAPIQRM